MTPSGDKPNPSGSDPLVKDHKYGVVPPEAANVCAGYAAPSPPFGNVLVRSANGCTTVIESERVTEAGTVALSATRTVKLKEPVRVGVPEMAPVLERLKPGGNGRDVGVSDHVYGDVPPIAVSDTE
jgi:hypothetical protein